MEAWSSGSGEGDGASRRSQRTLTIGLGLGHWWITGGYGEPRFSSPSPHLLFIALRDRGPSAMRTAGPPDQGMDQGPNWPLGQLGGDQPNNAFSHGKNPRRERSFLWANFLYIF